MTETILIARDRKTGRDVILAGRELGYPKQKDAYQVFTGGVHEDYSQVVLAYVTPAKRPLRLLTKAEATHREEQHKKAVAVAESEQKKAEELKEEKATAQPKAKKQSTK